MTNNEVVKDYHSISMAGCKYDWVDFDLDASQHNMNRSQFMQHLYIKFKEKKRFVEVRIAEVLMLLLMVVILLLLIVVNM